WPARPPPVPTLSPYTTLFRSLSGQRYCPEPPRAGPSPRLKPEGRATALGCPALGLLLSTLPEGGRSPHRGAALTSCAGARPAPRSEEHTSELQSRENLVCRLL